MGWQGERTPAPLGYGCTAGVVTDRATATPESGRDTSCRMGVCPRRSTHMSGVPATMRMSASVSDTSISLDTERWVLACQQVCWSLTRVDRATGRRRTVEPADAMPPSIPHYHLPEPCTGWTYRRVCFREIVSFIVHNFQGIKNGGHGATPSSHATTLKGGGCLLRSSQHEGTGAASREEQSSVITSHLSQKIYVTVLQKQN